jgi:hypothetical protein
MLVLSISVSLLMLLSSLSLQALVLQGRSLELVRQRRRLQEDRLMAAAQQLAGALQRRHRCLLPLAAEQWPQADCIAGGAAVAALGQGMAADQPWQLAAYRPRPGGSASAGSAELLLRGGGAQAAYAVHWRAAAGELPRLLAVQELGLTGAER